MQTQYTNLSDKGPRLKLYNIRIYSYEPSGILQKVLAWQDSSNESTVS